MVKATALWLIATVQALPMTERSLHPGSPPELSRNLKVPPELSRDLKANNLYKHLVSGYPAWVHLSYAINFKADATLEIRDPDVIKELVDSLEVLATDWGSAFLGAPYVRVQFEGGLAFEAQMEETVWTCWDKGDMTISPQFRRKLKEIIERTTGFKRAFEIPWFPSAAPAPRSSSARSLPP